MSKKIKKVIYIVLCAVFVTSSIAQYSFADKASSGVTMQNVRSKIMEEGKARVAANVLYKCIRGQRQVSGDGGGAHEGDDIRDVRKIFLQDTRIGAGAWYEKQRGDVDGRMNGTIYCGEDSDKIRSNIIAQFAKHVIGQDNEDTIALILCGMSNQGGLFLRDGERKANCSKGIGDKKYDYYWASEADATNTLQEIYEHYAEEKGWYDGRWSMIGNYDESAGYGMYLQEIIAGCMDDSDRFATASEPHVSNTLKYLDDTGAYITKYVPGTDSLYPVPDTDRAGERTSFVTVAKNQTCNWIVGRASQIVPEVQKKMFELIEAGCKEAYETQRDAAQAIIDNPDSSDKRKESAQQVVDEFNGLTSFTQDVKNEEGNIGKECIDVEYLTKPIQDDYDPYEDADDTNDANCYTNAGSLGWILCPIIGSLKDFILDKYEKWVVPALEMDTDLFLTESKNGVVNGTYQAWEIFRDIANILFVALFIIVIFSQLTGFGIDNYGIKKILPKLIIGAILINLSYIICQLAIDICNISGRGIGALFQSIGDQIPYPTSIKVDAQTAPETAWQSFTSSGWNGILVAIVGALGAAAVLSQGLAIIVPALLLLVSVAFAIFSLIAILGIRQAAAVLLVAVSPIAFACYMLPNTKSIFNKWFNFFKGLLIAYPICSALVYGGDLAGKILMNVNATSGNTWIIISAAVVSVAPIFFIPKVIKGSMGALSAGAAALIGGRLGGMARRNAGRALAPAAARLNQVDPLKRRMRYRQMMNQQKEMAKTGEYNAKRGQKLIDKYADKGKTPANMTAAQRRKYNVAMGAVNARNQEMENAYKTSFSGKSDKDIIGELQNAAGNGTLDSNMLTAGLSSINDSDQLFGAFESLSGDENAQALFQDHDTQQRIASVFSGRDDVINQSIGKLMRTEGLSFAKMTEGGRNSRLAQKVSSAGVGAMSGINKDAFKIKNAADYFSDEQLRAGATAGYSGGTADLFNNMLATKDANGKAVRGTDGKITGSALSEERQQNIISGMTAQQIASLSSETLTGIGGAEKVQQHASGALETLTSEDGARLRTSMDSEVRSRLLNESVPTDSNSGGGTATATDGYSSATTSTNATVNSDYEYGASDYDYNFGGEESGGAPAPAQDDAPLVINHDSTGTPAQAEVAPVDEVSAPAPAEVPAQAEATPANNAQEPTLAQQRASHTSTNFGTRTIVGSSSKGQPKTGHKPMEGEAFRPRSENGGSSSDATPGGSDGMHFNPNSGKDD